MNIIDMRLAQKEALTRAEAIVAACEQAKRVMTEGEREDYTKAMSAYKDWGDTATARDGLTTIRNLWPNGKPGPLDPANGVRGVAPAPAKAALVRGRGQTPMSADYTESFLAFLRSGGKQTGSALSEGFDPLFGGFALPAFQGMSAASYEGAGGGSNAAGGYAFNLPTDNQIVPLAVIDLGVRAVAKVIPTETDIKIPGQATFATAGIKVESGSATNSFSESEPTLDQFTLSAYMLGLYAKASWELLQDVQVFQEFLVRDLIDAVSINEDNFFVNGSGSGQPQGLIGNVGTGTAAPYLLESTGAYLLDSTIDVVGTLKGAYYANAGWLMSRATATAIRRAQIQANLFAPVWTREGGRDYLHGFPVTYSQAMPALPTATTAGVTPILFGSFQDGYVVGDRGGSGTFIKILDQPLALSGQTAFIGYKRVDGKIRQSEAIQQISISHS